MRGLVFAGIVCLLFGLPAAGCVARTQALVIPFTSVRPVAHVGVLAPFEGLYRRSGYSALEAVRGAVAAAPPAHTGLIALALDTSRDPARAAAKIAASAHVGAVVGPFTPQEGAAAAPALAAMPWLAPWAVTEAGFVAPQETAWLEALARALGESARAQGARRLLVGGTLPAWEPSLRAGFEPLPTIMLVDGPGGFIAHPGDALVWLGSPAEGAAATIELRALLPDAPVWLAPWAIDPVFFEHLQPAATAQGAEPPAIYAVVWAGPHDAAWASAHPQGMPSAYLMYEAAVQATALATASTLPAPAAWQWRAVRVGPTGVGDVLLP